jgi:hypothetical protein
MIKIVGYIGLQVKYTLFLSDSNDFELSPQIFEKILKYKISLSFANWFVRNENSENLFMKEIKIYVWDANPLAGTKDKKAAGSYKSPYKNSKWERYFGAVPLHERISSVTLSLICANNWQIQVLVKTVGGVSQQQRVLVVVCLSECEPKKKCSRIIQQRE